MAHRNLAGMSTSTTGTGTITLGSALADYLSLAAAGVVDGEKLTYFIEDGNSREVSRGVYTASGTTLSRGRCLASTNSGSFLNLSGSAKIYIGLAANDVMSVNEWDSVILKDEFVGGSTTSGAIGELGWTVVNGSGNAGSTAIGAGHPGVWERRHNSATVAQMHLQGGNSLCRFQDVQEVTIIAKMVSTWDNAQNHRFGFVIGTGSQPTDGVYFERLAADVGYYGVVRDTGSQTRTAQLLANDNNWHTFTIRRNSSTSWSFIVDGTVTTISGDGNIPTDSSLCLFVITDFNASGTTLRLFAIDFFLLRMVPIDR